MFSRLAALTLVVAVLSSADSSHAETLGRNDPVGDVVREGAAGGTRAGRQTLENTDLTRVVVKHKPRLVVTRLTYDSFSTVGFEEIYISQLLRTSDGERFSVFVRLDHQLQDVDLMIYEADTGSSVECPSAHVTVERDKLRVHWGIPRTCIGNPDWIRFRGAAGSVTENVVRFADDMLTAHAPGQKLSPRIRREESSKGL